MSNIDRLDTFEVACKHFLGDFSNFKNLISTQVQSLDDLEWSFDKGSTKVCSATTLNQIERVCSNEELGRYQFIANNSIGDEITCDIYLPNEWNIPQLNMLGCVSARYRKVDVKEV